MPEAAPDSRHPAGRDTIAAAVEPLDALLRQAFAADLRLLAVLNDREPSAELIASLRTAPAASWFAYHVTKTKAEGARTLLDKALAEIPAPVDAATRDELAADFAAIYLLHTYRAPPTESPWLDKDQLERQEPMFQIAECYRRFGLAAENRQVRSDDHLVLQLQFLAHVMESPAIDAEVSAREASRFLDDHLLRWVGDWAERIAARCATPYFCGVVMLTASYLEAMRDHLAERFALPRPKPEEPGKSVADDLRQDEEIARYLPGVSPSW